MYNAVFEEKKAELLEMLDMAMLDDDDELLFIVAASLEELEGEYEDWFHGHLMERVPDLSMGTGKWRRALLYGSASGFATTGESTIILSGGEFLSAFRFDRRDIPQLVRELRVPDSVVLPCKGRLAGDEALLVTLRMLAYPSRLPDLSHFFRRATGYLSEVFNFITGHIYEHFGVPLLRQPRFDHLQPKLAYFADRFASKVVPTSNGDETLRPAHDNLWIMYDGTHRDFCRPGPLPHVIGGQRFQEAVYNGRTHSHCFQYMGGISPDGIIRDASGPSVGKAHDMRQYREQLVAERLRRDCHVNGVQYIAGGDCAFGRSDVMVAPFKGTQLSPVQKLFNEIFKRLRIGVEWGFGWVVRDFAYIDFKKSQVVGNRPIAKYYLAAVILTNCRSCLYGNQVASYFDCSRPTLHDYLNRIALKKKPK